LKAPTKKGSFEGTYTCNLKLGEYGILDKKKVKFSFTIHHSEGLLYCVHVSIWGPAKTASLRGHRYFISFIDNLSRHYWIYPIRQIFEALGLLVKWKDMMEKHTRKKIKGLQIVNVERYKNQFLQFGQNIGISTHFTNGIHKMAKEINCYLLKKARCLLSNAQLDNSFVYASHLINRLSSTAIGGKMPLEVCFEKAA